MDRAPADLNSAASAAGAAAKCSSNIRQEGLAPERRERTGLHVPSSRATGRPALTLDIRPTEQPVTRGAGEALEAMDGGQLEEPRSAPGEGGLGTWGVFAHSVTCRVDKLQI